MKIKYCVFVSNIENEFFQQIVRDMLSLILDNQHVDFTDIGDLTMIADPVLPPVNRSISVSVDLDTDDFPFWTNEDFAERIIADEDGTETENVKLSNRVPFLQSYQRNFYFIDDYILVLAYNEFGGDPWEDYVNDLVYVRMIIHNFGDDLDYLGRKICVWEKEYHIDLCVRLVSSLKVDGIGDQFQDF